MWPARATRRDERLAVWPFTRSAKGSSTCATARLRRIVGPAGAVLAASKNPGPLDYYELYDAVSLQFAYVRMIGEVPFAGVTIAELGEESDDEDAGPEVTVQTQLAGDPEPPSW